MSNLCFIFPGQGSQYAGMGKALFDRYEIARSTYKKADDILGYSLSSVCFEGPEEELRKTGNTQPGIFVISAIVQTILKDAGIKPLATAGHSLGEYSALYAAGCLSFEDALHLVIERGKAMNKASESRKGSMAAVIGLNVSRINEICGNVADKGIVQIANINSPNQLVITGDSEAVKIAMGKAKEAGASRVIPLSVHGAFHSPLMEEAASRMKDVLGGVNIQEPEIPFVNNADAAFLTDPESIRDSLIRQVTSCVRWVACMEKLMELEPRGMVEAGPGKVLAGLGRRIAKDLEIYPCETPEQIEKIAHAQ
ncbi:ACP S-malonyltransferase [Candidatus Sumerlaeota bacterium]|nr:ACP S-malonyltransferase [Candidatus Sumerlaeota bacterium]